MTALPGTDPARVASPRASGTPPVSQVFEAAGTWLPWLMGRVEHRLGEIAAAPGEPLRSGSKTTLDAGGKRLRPMLVLLCAGPEAGEASIRAATAVELVHMATLVHDDVLDGAPLRRGAPTVVATAGPQRAAAVGDYLFSRAFAELGEPGSGPQVRLLAETAVRLARGELAQRRDSFDASIGADRYLERCRLKTASLFECACRIGRAAEPGSALGDATDAALGEFGREIGLAFQLLDDILDVSGPAERTGKARGTDLLDGTVTLPLIVARDRDPELAAIDLASLDPETADALCDRIARTGSLEVARTRARDRIDAARRALEPAAIDADRRELLGIVADGVVERYA